jgi:7,8-dihydropterin-6-yl-methyl-4-(beta-D-ribofuranosyl)aminobenzene 5'-phosphate synthase
MKGQTIMKVKVLVENSVAKTNPQSVTPKHGLSLYIEYDDKRILFDVGPSDLFIKNANKMGIDLSKVEYVFLSHGHFDHGGGLKYLFEINQTAKIYIHRLASRKYYGKIFGLIPFYIGLDQRVIRENADRVVFVDQDMQIMDGINLLAGFSNEFPQPEANKHLFEKSDRGFIPDKFRHEMGLVLKENNGMVLFTGCAHSGIINMVDEAMGRFPNKKIKAIFGGFHIFNPLNKKKESDAYIQKLIEAMGKIDSIFYTGHCTGESNFKRLKEKLGEKIQTMNTGERIEID